jgi:putative membrane protein
VNDSPYSRFADTDLILRDELAIDRTLLANERTLLAYLRAAVSLVIAGVTIMHFSSVGWFWAFGLACLPLGVIVGALGVARYATMGRKIGSIERLAEKRHGVRGGSRDEVT